jgi:hypothetical protein
VVQYTFYRITSSTPDSLEFVLKDILDCRYRKEKRHRLSTGIYELQSTNTNPAKKIRFWKKAVGMNLEEWRLGLAAGLVFYNCLPGN